MHEIHINKSMSMNITQATKNTTHALGTRARTHTHTHTHRRRHTRQTTTATTPPPITTQKRNDNRVPQHQVSTNQKTHVRKKTHVPRSFWSFLVALATCACRPRPRLDLAKSQNMVWENWMDMLVRSRVCLGWQRKKNKTAHTSDCRMCLEAPRMTRSVHSRYAQISLLTPLLSLKSLKRGRVSGAEGRNKCV